jgi:lysylphosphatidylglycerol synthetase-like protein (DUF2156 family)
MQRSFSLLGRTLARYPLALVVSAAATGAGAANLVWAGEIEFTGAGFSALSWMVLVASLAAAERIFGSGRAAVIAAVTTTTGVVAGWAILTGLSAAGEPLSQEALRYQAWTPSVTSAAMLMAVSGRLRPGTRRTVRWVAGTGVVAFLLISGHASDTARGLAAVAGVLAGILGSRSLPATAWRRTASTRWRSVLAAALVVIATALATASATPNATGILAWTGSAIDPAAALAVASLLLIGAGLIASGRRSGLIVGGSALLVVAAVAFMELVLAPIASGDLGWAGLTGADLEWQAIPLLAAGIPAVAVLLLALGARRVVRRAAVPPTTADRQRLQSVLRRTGNGTFAHMATWAGNSLWFGPDGSAIAYRVRDGVAFTIGDPIAERPAELVPSFAAFCEGRGWTPVFYSVHDEVAASLEQAGWTRTPVGTDAVIDTSGFSLSGRKRQDLRTAVNRADREGMTAVWTTYSQCSERTREQLDALCADWAAAKKLPEMGFTLGGLAELTDPDAWLTLAVAADGRIHAVTSWLPRYRDEVVVGWTLDVMRRAEEAMPGAMEFAIVSMIRRAAADGVETVSLSGTPLAVHDGVEAGALTRRLVRLLEPAYGFASLERFKMKFGARPEALWMCYPQPVQLGRIAPALLRTYVPGLRLRGVVAVLREAA